jgi:hypothetical protein
MRSACGRLSITGSCVTGGSHVLSLGRRIASATSAQGIVHLRVRLDAAGIYSASRSRRTTLAGTGSLYNENASPCRQVHTDVGQCAVRRPAGHTGPGGGASWLARRGPLRKETVPFRSGNRAGDRPRPSASYKDKPGRAWVAGRLGGVSRTATHASGTGARTGKSPRVGPAGVSYTTVAQARTGSPGRRSGRKGMVTFRFWARLVITQPWHRREPDLQAGGQAVREWSLLGSGRGWLASGRGT